MKLKLYTLTLLFYCCTALCAQELWLKSPLQYIPAEEVHIWAYTGQDFREMALQAEPNAKTSKIVISNQIWNSRDRIAETWETLQPELNVVGGGGDEIYEKQGLPAMMGVAANAYMFLMTGKARHTDFIERSVFNATLRSMSDSTLKKGSQDLRGAAEVLMSIPGWMYAKSRDDKDLYVNLYSNSTSNVHLQNQKITIDQITNMPTDGRIKLRLMKDANPIKLRIHLRVPEWAVQRATAGNAYAFVGKKPEMYRAFVNGHEIENVQPDEKGYLVIDRVWRSGDEIYMDYPMTPQYLRKTDAQTNLPVRGEVALQVGPMVYLITTPVKGCYFSTNTMPGRSDRVSDKGYDILKGTMFRYENTPQDALAPKVDFWAEPYFEGKSGVVWGKEIK